MKKFLVTGGVLFSVLPAMALELPSDLIAGSASINCSSTQDPEFAVAHDSENPMDMQAVYVTNACDPTKYLSVSGNSPVIGNDGILENANCETCTAGSYCPGLSDITITNNQLESSYGMTACAAGTYSGSGASECTACSAGTYTNQTGQTSCTNAQAGYYTPNATSEAQCPYGYRDGLAGTGTSIDACSKTVSCTNACNNFNNIVTSGNDACSATVNSNNASIVNGTVAFGDRGTEPLCTVNKTCLPGYTTTNLYAWLAAHPASFSANYSFCSPDGTSAGCTTQEPGTLTFRLNNAPINEAHFVIVCTNTTPDSGIVIDQTPANFSITTPSGAHSWIKNVDLPNQPWIYAGEWDSTEQCISHGLDLEPANATYLFGEMQNNAFSLNNAGQGFIGEMSYVATETANNASAEVCIPGTIYMDWGDVEDAGAAATCTYGEGFSAPAAPTPEAGYKFLGWKVTSTTNND